MSSTKNPTTTAAGVLLIVGCTVGAGMFSLPVVSSGMWYSLTVCMMILTALFMGTTSLFILETNLNFKPGASFDTLVKNTLGQSWNIINGLAVAFVLYILTYAYISGSGAMVKQTLQNGIGLTLPQPFAAVLFTIVFATIVWFSAAAVSRIVAITLTGMLITFLLSMADLTANIQVSRLFELNSNNTLIDYFPYLFAALPFYLTSFGFHSIVPSLVKHYGENSTLVVRCILYGVSITLLVYLLWLTSAFGNISRPEFKSIVQAGGNIDVLSTALSNTVHQPRIASIFTIFANFALISSFLGVTLGLFDYIADLCKFSNTRKGRLQTAIVTFLPPMSVAILFPHGFIYAIGFAGLAAAIWGVVVPSMMVKASRQQFASAKFQVPGGNLLCNIMIFYGLLVMICHLLAMANILPVYGR